MPVTIMAAVARPPPKRWKMPSRDLDGESCAGDARFDPGWRLFPRPSSPPPRACHHVLVPDSVYRPTRNFCNGVSNRLGIETGYYDPVIAAGIDKLFKANTRAVFAELPGSHSFEMQDIPAIVGCEGEGREWR